MTGLADTIGGFGPVHGAALDLLQRGGRIRERFSAWDETRRGDVDDDVDGFVVGATALLCFAPEHAGRVVDAFRIVVGDGGEHGGPLNARHEALLARLVYGTATCVLYLGGPTALAPLRGVALDAEPLFGTDAIRFARYHSGDANVAYAAVARWVAEQSWADELPGVDPDSLPVAIAEADLLLACIALTRMDRQETYAAGCIAAATAAPLRLGRRLADPGQRAGLSILLGTDDAELEQALTNARGAIRAQTSQGTPVRIGSIVP